MPLLILAGLGLAGIITGGVVADDVGQTAVSDLNANATGVEDTVNQTTSTISSTVIYAALGLGALYFLANRK